MQSHQLKIASLPKAPQTSRSKAICYKTKNEQLQEKAVHVSLVATNCFHAGLSTIFCTIIGFTNQFCQLYRYILENAEKQQRNPLRFSEFLCLIVGVL